MAEKSAEQQARDLLESIGVPNAQSYSSGTVVELANLIAAVHRGGKRKHDFKRAALLERNKIKQAVLFALPIGVDISNIVIALSEIIIQFAEFDEDAEETAPSTRVSDRLRVSE